MVGNQADGPSGPRVGYIGKVLLWGKWMTHPLVWAAVGAVMLLFSCMVTKWAYTSGFPDADTSIGSVLWAFVRLAFKLLMMGLAPMAIVGCISLIITCFHEASQRRNFK